MPAQEGKEVEKEGPTTLASGVNEANMKLYFKQIDNAFLLLKKEQEYAVLYMDNNRVMVAFYTSEDDFVFTYGDDLRIEDADLAGWQVVATKRRWQRKMSENREDAIGQGDDVIIYTRNGNLKGWIHILAAYGIELGTPDNIVLVPWNDIIRVVKQKKVR